jgi:Domain of unknown function (DUF5615)
VKFLVDAQLPPALARLLGELGQEAAAGRDVNLREAEDGPIWQYALEHSTVIVTKDEDFPERSLRSPPRRKSSGCASATAPTAPCSPGSARSGRRSSGGCSRATASSK